MLPTALERLLRLHHEHLEQVADVSCRLESGLRLPNQPQQAAHVLVAVPALQSTEPYFRQVQPLLADEQVLLPRVQPRDVQHDRERGVIPEQAKAAAGSVLRSALQ